jgi:hypothetical protein
MYQNSRHDGKVADVDRSAWGLRRCQDSHQLGKPLLMDDPSLRERAPLVAP